jgi:hypothetical protein
MAGMMDGSESRDCNLFNSSSIIMNDIELLLWILVALRASSSGQVQPPTVSKA